MLTGWTPTEFTQFWKEVLTPIVTIMGTVLIALIGRGIRHSADNETLSKEDTQLADTFGSGTLHYIAMQAKQISDLEESLKESLTRNRELISELALVRSTADRQQRAEDRSLVVPPSTEKS